MKISSGAFRLPLQFASKGSRRLARASVFFLSILFSGVARAQAPTSLDLNFTAPDFSENIDEIESLVTQPDKKVVVGGTFTLQGDNLTFSRIARLLQDGALDTSFQAGGGADGEVKSVSLQTDGKIMLGGGFNRIDGIARTAVARLNVDGALDQTFHPRSGVTSEEDFPIASVAAVALQTDGRVLIAGHFSQINGISRRNVARLNSDGSLDGSFVPGNAGDGEILAELVLPDGKLLVAGLFTQVSGAPRHNIARLNSDGSIDKAFAASSDGQITSLILQADGKIVVSGDFTQVDGIARMQIARLNADGTLDATFNPGSGPNSSILALAALGDKVLIGGQFSQFNGTPVPHLALLGPDGSIDFTFDAGGGPNDRVSSLAIDINGKIVVGGLFSQFAGLPRFHIARLNRTGSVDGTFNPETPPVIPSFGNVKRILAQDDGRIYAVANVTVRYNSNGTLDHNFTSPSLSASPRSIAEQPDKKLLIGGSFYIVNGTVRTEIARLNPDGSLDASFDVGSGVTGKVWSIALPNDGKVLIAGDFGQIDGKAIRGIARLSPDGLLDPTFNSPIREGSVEALGLQANGQAIIAGTWSDDSGNGPRLARLNPDGGIDPTFNPAASFENSTRTLAIQADDKILTNAVVDGERVIVRLNPNGSADGSFHIAHVDGVVTFLGVAGNGKIIVGGLFTEIAGVRRNYVAQLNEDGTVDLNFNAGSGPNGYVRSIALQAPDKVIIAGGFNEVDGIARLGVARLNGEGIGGGLANISTRAQVLTGDQVVIGGFIIEGSQAKRVLVRALGPTLTQPPFNVAGALSNPVLELHHSNAQGEDTIIASNDNWKETQSAEISATGFSPPNDLDSAMVLSLAPGSYTAIVRGADDGSGVGLVEVYDVDNTSSSFLKNISTRSVVGAGDKVMIAGLVVGPAGAESEPVLIRALGPTLSQSPFFIPTALGDPVLELHDGNGALLAVNDNWKDTQQDAVQATGLAPPADQESALLTSLPPGKFTAIVRGKNDTTGVALVEVYRLR